MADRLGQKYCVVTLLDQSKGTSLFHASEWPLHITLVQPFAFPGTFEKLTEVLGVISTPGPFTAVAQNDGFLGKGVPVTYVNAATGLQQLHETLINSLEARGATFNTPKHNRSGYVAHATIQKSGRVSSGDVIKIDHIALIDMFPEKDASLRKVVWTRPLH